MGEATLWAYKPWALSFELWSTNLFLQAPKYSHKKSKNGHNASIWYVLHAGCFYYAKPTDKRPVGMPEENGTTCGKGKESDPTDVFVNTSANASVDTPPTHYWHVGRHTTDRANQDESVSYHFLLIFQIPYRSEKKYCTDPVCQK